MYDFYIYRVFSSSDISLHLYWTVSKFIFILPRNLWISILSSPYKDSAVGIPWWTVVCITIPVAGHGYCGGSRRISFWLVQFLWFYKFRLFTKKYCLSTSLCLLHDTQSWSTQSSRWQKFGVTYSSRCSVSSSFRLLWFNWILKIPSWIGKN